MDSNPDSRVILERKSFNYNLPKELIAQAPLEPRDSSRLLTLKRSTGKVNHRHFYDILDYINPGDCLVLNNSKVLPARLYGINSKTGAHIEILLLSSRGQDIWETIVKPGKKVRTGAHLIFGDGILQAYVRDVLEDGNRIIEFVHTPDFFTRLESIGEMPLPPYIKEKLHNGSRYQTVYAKDAGSAAAPTAGLHFTPSLLQKIKNKGAALCFVTLHVGLGTFRPVKEENIINHKMHSEHYILSSETAQTINTSKQSGGKIIAVGTTSCRTLESIVSRHRKIVPDEGWTDIFIYPGYEFKAIDSLITNFHLPESTLIMLVSAFAGYDNTIKAYESAVNEKYRFFSFGDAMMIY